MDLGHCINYVVDDDYYYDEIGDLHIFAFSDIFSCVLLQLMQYVDVCCWVGLGWVRSAYISCGLGWVIDNGPTTMSVSAHSAE